MALHFAIRNKLLSDVRSLVESGADVNARDKDSRTPLVMCCLDNDESWSAGVARMLLQEGAKVGIQDKDGRNALMFTSAFGRPKLNDLFLKAVDFDLNKKDVLGNTALHFSALHGDKNITSKLLSALRQAGLDINVRNRMGQTAAGLAFQQGHLSCVEEFRKENCPADFGTKVPGVLLMKPWSTEMQFLEDPSLILKNAVSEVLHGAKLHLSRSDINVHQFRRGSRIPDNVLLKTKKYKPKYKSIKSGAKKNNRSMEPIKLVTQFNKNQSSLFDANVLSPRKHYTESPSWRNEMPGLMDELHVQVSPSYRSTAIARPQTYSEIFTPPELAAQPPAEEQTTETQNSSTAPLNRRKSSMNLGGSHSKSNLCDSSPLQSSTEGKRRGRKASQHGADTAVLQKRKTTDKLPMVATGASQPPSLEASRPDNGDQELQQMSNTSSIKSPSPKPDNSKTVKALTQTEVKLLNSAVLTTKTTASLSTNEQNEETNNASSTATTKMALSDITEETV